MQTAVRARRRSLLALAALSLAASVPGGCSWSIFSGGTSSVTTSSSMTGQYIAAELPVAVFTTADESSTDLYMTDLPLSRLADMNDTLADASGSIVHVHIFLIPEAGRTPIDDSAVNAAVRHVVIAKGGIGVYAGGGLCLTDEPSGDAHTATVRNATLRVARAAGGFNDALGPAVINANVRAVQDEKACRIIAARLAQFNLQLPAAK